MDINENDFKKVNHNQQFYDIICSLLIYRLIYLIPHSYEQPLRWPQVTI